MTNEFNLSEEIKDNGRKISHTGEDLTFIPSQKVAKFIQLLKQELQGTREYGIQDCEFTIGEIFEIIDTLAGEHFQSPKPTNNDNLQKKECVGDSSEKTAQSPQNFKPKKGMTCFFCKKRPPALFLRGTPNESVCSVCNQKHPITRVRLKKEVSQ